jgi:hypothetical protein
VGRTRGVFSSPQAEGARGFKSPSLRQAGRDLRAPLENPAKFARVRGFPAVVRDRRAIVWACFGPILRISLRGEVKRAPSPMPAQKDRHAIIILIKRGEVAYSGYRMPASSSS